MAEEMLTIAERRKYLKRVQPRYLQADRAGRGALLTEMEAVTGLHRKSLTRLLRALAVYALYSYALVAVSPECGTMVCAVLWG